MNEHAVEYPFPAGKVDIQITITGPDGDQLCLTLLEGYSGPEAINLTHFTSYKEDIISSVNIVVDSVLEHFVTLNIERLRLIEVKDHGLYTLTSTSQGKVIES